MITLDNWFPANNLRINIRQTHILNFNRQGPHTASIDIKCFELESSEQVMLVYNWITDFIGNLINSIKVYLGNIDMLYHNFDMA